MDGIQSSTIAFLLRNKVFGGGSVAQRNTFLCSNKLVDLADKIIKDESCRYINEYFLVRPQRKLQAILLDQMNDLVRAFSCRNVHFAFLKGVLFGYELFAELGKRHTSDIDIYVAFDQLSVAMDILHELGYYTKDNAIFSGKDYVNAFHRGDLRMRVVRRHFSVVKQNNGMEINVELHATIVRTYEHTTNATLQSQSASVFKNIRHLFLNNAIYPILGFVDNFLMLCVHFARHSIEAISCFCCSEAKSRCIPMDSLYHTALFYRKYATNLDSEELLETARRYQCLADLAFTARYLYEIYGIQIWQDIGSVCIKESEDDVENKIYNAIVMSLNADELFWGDRLAIFEKLQALVDPPKTYLCQPYFADQFPKADCEVIEECDTESPYAKIRNPLSFKWGAAVSKQCLALSVEIPTKSIYFFYDGDRLICCPSILIQFSGAHCQAKQGNCIERYSIELYKELSNLRMNIKYNGMPSNLQGVICETNKLIKINLYINVPVGVSENGLRFMISAEMSLPYSNKNVKRQRMRFSVRWVDSVAVSYNTCLSFGELRFNQDCQKALQS